MEGTLLSILPILRPFWQEPVGWGVVALVSGLFYWLGRHFVTRPAPGPGQEARIRSRIAANLHDELGSLLMRIHVQAEAMLRPPQRDKTRLVRLLATTQAACSAMRDVAWGLDASADTTEALQDRMRDLLDQLALNTPLDIRFTVEGLDDASVLSGRLRQELFLVFKEATTNALRHALGPTYLAVRLYRQPGSLVLEVKDDGALGETTGRRGMGLRNMQRRAQGVGGQLEAGPRTDGPGFRVWFWVPLAPATPASWLFRELNKATQLLA